MAQRMCDICGVRPAAIRVAVLQDNQERELDICDYHYAQLMRHQRMVSPLESLFQGGLLDNFMQGDPSDAPRLGGRRGHRDQNADTINLQDHFSEQAKEILQRAAERAVRSGRQLVDTEDLLYELPESDVVQTLLKQFKISVDELRNQIDTHAPKGTASAQPREGGIGVSPRVKSALDRAFIASRELGHSYVGPEHILLGLAEVTDSFAGNLLLRYGLTPQALRQQTVKVVGKGAEKGRVETPTNTPQLDKYSRDLTKMAREGKLDPVIGRSKEVETTIEILARRKKNNPVLIGEPGVGKTAIVEGLAQRIINGDVPEVLRDKRLVELNVNSLVAGSKYRGEFEERVKQVMDEISDKRDELLLFIDEVHMIVGAGQGGGEGGLDIANVFKPAMARGEINLIGATTLSEYQKHIEKDAALERRFQPVLVSEPTVEQTIAILRGLRDRLEAHHKVTIQDEAFVAAAELSDRYITGRFLPDKAIDLIDQAAARVRLSTTSRPAEIHELEAEIAQLKREHDSAVSRKQFDRVKDFDSQLATKEKALTEATDVWKRKVGSSTAGVSTEQVAEIVSKLTGIPITELTEEEKAKLLRMEERLHQRVIGQEEAIRAVSDAVRLSRAGLQQGHRPIATFLFLGPTGVGKTELAKALAEIVFGDEDAVVRIDMSEYMERHAVARLIGAPPGYVGYDEGGQLTERVRRRPYCVILLDEIEKAHADVYNVLLQVFDDGRLTDGKGRVVDFSNTLIIATSNLASDVVMGRRGQLGFHPPSSSSSVRDDVMSVLRSHFRPEFINRIDEIIIFQSLDQVQIKEIVRLQLQRVQKIAQGQDIELVFDETLVEHFASEGYQPEYGARELRRQIRQQLETELAKSMLKGEIKEGNRVVCAYDAKAGKVTFAVEQAQPTATNGDASAKPAQPAKPQKTADAARGDGKSHQNVVHQRSAE
ncbi:MULTISPECIES: ATP-dependent Clp protease ATP-binding subunit [unclassified Beijerinckia]|uniref:ATP-dependent Clp protease ATP-binding subunit n=1 Tax=unclassified Beijerinckia TaxID=2638183 RepID=UPI000897CF71|nr:MULTISPECIES: ATP-dependent Clp protease ATP-binding subunit [unclassified Beijerinckia]MDH7796958.1 ATP-dependent Clp protease ATP-binding subunit ClpC [Beijerinckia sp. GAS462]SEC66618.1 ATP-dependent Clp protease ATP-binding subunit ClpC [Beijerinckia sp. 28-YEA-48]